MNRVLLIHTAESQRIAYQDEATIYGDALCCDHHVERGWLARARAVGIDDPSLRNDITSFIANKLDQFDLIVCTCSTLGPIFDAVCSNNVVRADRALMKRAADVRGSIALAYCLDSTAKPSLDLLNECLAEQGSNTDVLTIHCENAWAHFETGALEEYAAAIERCVHTQVAVAAAVGCVILAQGSMAVASAALEKSLNIPVLCAPPIALAWLAHQPSSG